MRALWIAVGVGLTVYLFVSHAPLWICIINLVVDVWIILGYLKKD